MHECSSMQIFGNDLRFKIRIKSGHPDRWQHARPTENMWRSCSKSLIQSHPWGQPLSLKPRVFPKCYPLEGYWCLCYSVSLSYKQCVSCDSESDTGCRLASPASSLLAKDWLGDCCRAMPFVMLYIYRLCQHRAGGARRLHSVPDSMDASLRTSPHSSVYFLNRPLFGLTSVGREYLRKRGRKSVENKGKGKKLSVIETAPQCSWLRQSFRVLGAIKISHPGCRVGQTAERKTAYDAHKYPSRAC